MLPLVNMRLAERLLLIRQPTRLVVCIILEESGAKKPAPDDVDALLQDVKSLLGETDADIAAEAPAEPDTEDSEPITADDVQIDYGKFYGPEEPGQSKTPLTCYEQSKPAYQRARRAEYERVREQERLARAERQQALSRDDTSRVRQVRTGKKHEKQEGSGTLWT